MYERVLVYVGTYTHGESEGIYIFRLDQDTGGLEPIGKATNITNPSFLAVSPNKQYLYAVNEVGSFEGKRTGAVSSYSINLETGELTFLNTKPSGGASPCYVTVDGTGRYILVANYANGSVCVLPIMDDGSLGDATDIVQHRGSSVNPKRQEGPHAHSVILDPSNRYAYVADLGIDKIMIYKFDSERGKLIPNDQPWTSTHPGAGPRHFTIHPNQRFAYVINELDSTITAFSFDSETGRLKPMQTISTLPEGYEGTNYPADIHVSPSGRFLYGSNRGHNSIVIYNIDEETGRLSMIGHESTRGGIPRNFAIDPNGKFLFVANKESDNIVAFRLDEDTGLLEPIGEEVKVPTPVCIRFLPLNDS